MSTVEMGRMVSERKHLELSVRTKVRVLVVESNDDTERDETVSHVVDPCTTVGAIVEGPADGMDDFAGLVLSRIDTPDLLYTKTVSLRITTLAKLEASDSLL